MSKRLNALAGVLLWLVASPALAGEADVRAVQVHTSGDGTYRFDVTLQHADTGWDHYADRWEVLTPAGDIIATRTLYHPHVDEQPFTRSLSGIEIPPGVRQVVVRAHDSVHGYGGEQQRVELSASQK
jgi:hypothetical protein